MYVYMTYICALKFDHGAISRIKIETRMPARHSSFRYGNEACMTKPINFEEVFCWHELILSLIDQISEYLCTLRMFLSF